MNTLLHICCAPCSIMCIETLRAEGIEVHGYWYNPNIHPYTEYRSRKNCLIEYAKMIDLPLDVNDTYGLRDFVRAVADDIDGRCPKCYEMRLMETARYAKEHGYDSFTTTLLVSPYQNHELLLEYGRRASEIHSIEFLERDFRPCFREGQTIAREKELYMQKYCGCVFSEEDRYKKKPKKPKQPLPQQNG